MLRKLHFSRADGVNSEDTVAHPGMWMLPGISASFCSPVMTAQTSRQPKLTPALTVEHLCCTMWAPHRTILHHELLQ